MQPSRRAPAKQVYYHRDIWTKDRKLIIDHIAGYFTGAARQPFCDWLAETVAAAGHEIPQIDSFEDSGDGIGSIG